MRAMLAAGHPDEVVRIMMREVVQMPETEIAALQAQPSWPARVAAAPTLPRELSAPLSWDATAGGRVSVPVLVIAGEDSPAFQQQATRAVTGALPACQLVVMEGQQHIADQLAPRDFAAHVLSFLRAEQP
jgi:pimeloyl-ACP methyl ester carboxylesterase